MPNFYKNYSDIYEFLNDLQEKADTIKCNCDGDFDGETWNYYQCIYHKAEQLLKDVENEKEIEPEDHHAKDLNRKARSAQETINYINSDHPCCIPIGDAVALYHGIRKENAELRARIDALIEPGKATTYVKWAFDLAESLGYSSVSASGPGPFIEAKLAELKAEIERLNREWPEDASLEKRRAEKAEAALAEISSGLGQWTEEGKDG